MICLGLIVPMRGQYKFGIHGGMGSSNYLGKDFSSDNTPKLAPTGGLFYEHELNPTISLATEINYEKKGTSYNYSPKVATNISSDSKLEYITVPVIGKAYIDYKAIFYCYTGISGSYLTNSSNKVAVTEYGYTIDPEPFFNYQFRKFDAALLAGFGINIREIIFEMRYNYGIVDIYKGFNPPNIKNKFITATLGFTIYKKKVFHCMNRRSGAK